MYTDLTRDNFSDFVADSQVPVLVDFWAPWCGPCRMLSPIVEDVAEEFAGKISVGKVNVDDNPELSMMYNVSSIPLLVLFKGGKVVDKSLGYISDEELRSFITKNI